MLDCLFFKGAFAHFLLYIYIYIYSIEVIRSPTTSTEMTSKRKVRNPEITIKPIVRRKIQPNKHSIGRIPNAINVARKTISGMSVDPKLKL